MKKSPKPRVYGHSEDCAWGMAEKEGFEPSRQLSHPTPLAGEPLRPLGYFSTAYKIYSSGGERGIRTPGAFRHHWFSRPAPSTTRPSLPAQPAWMIISDSKRLVNPKNRAIKPRLRGAAGSAIMIGDERKKGGERTCGWTRRSRSRAAPARRRRR